MTTLDEVRAALIDELKLDVRPEDLRPETVLFGDGGLGLDSIDALELVVILKRRFGVDVKDRDEGQRAFASLGALVALVERSRQPKKA
jgi:acyl carrier protein